MDAGNLPRLVVLDGHTLNPGDLSWSELKRECACTIHARTAPADILERAAGATILLTNKVPLTAATLAALPDLRYIGVLATGYNVVDVVAARARGIAVSNVPAYGTSAVAQHVFALLLELTQRVGHHAAGVRAGRWSSSPDWSYWDCPLIELSGLTLGLVGSGRISTAVARIGTALGMTVIFARRSGGPAELEHVLRTADVVSLHCPLTPATDRLINATTLAKMKPGALLINTARGQLIDEPALAEALTKGQLAGAGLDVLSLEPPPRDHPLLGAPNCIITPHQAWAAHAARARLLGVALNNVRAFLAGQPQNVIN